MMPRVMEEEDHDREDLPLLPLEPDDARIDMSINRVI